MHRLEQLWSGRFLNRDSCWMVSRSCQWELEAGLPAEGLEAFKLRALRALGAEEVSAFGGDGGWGRLVGLSAGVLATDDPPLSKVSP
jgi:hypothetical protein